MPQIHPEKDAAQAWSVHQITRSDRGETGRGARTLRSAALLLPSEKRRLQKGTAHDNELESLRGEPDRQNAAYRCGTITVLGSHRLHAAAWRGERVYIAGIAPYQPGQLQLSFDPVRHGDDGIESQGYPDAVAQRRMDQHPTVLTTVEMTY